MASSILKTTKFRFPNKLCRPSKGKIMGAWITTVAGKCVGAGDFMTIIAAILAALSAIGAACPIPLPPLATMSDGDKHFWLTLGALRAGYRPREIDVKTAIKAMAAEPITPEQEATYRSTWVLG